MFVRMVGKSGLVVLVASLSVLSGWDSRAYSRVPAQGLHGESESLSLEGAGSGVPAWPATLVLPEPAIVAGRGSVGYLPGSGGVDQKGQFNYTIPIDVPAGRAGMQPSLSLSYSSSGGNGVLGVGWTLSGVSSIARCAQTLATEGVVRGVHLTDFAATAEAHRDRFCLNGQKLMAVQGSYGQDGTEYRTEADSYARIVSTQSPTVKGDLIFTVQTKAGHTLIYTGMHATQSLTGLNQSVSTAFTGATWWALTSEVDRTGNGVQYIYTPLIRSNPATWGNAYPQMSQWQLTRIVYTTAADGSDAGHREVTFSYEDRPDPEFVYQAGVGTALFQRLTTITASAPDPAQTAPVWQYTITYEPQASSFSGRSLVSSVQRCGIGSNGAAGGCTLKKIFNWSSGSSRPPFSGDWQTVGGLNGQWQWPVGGLLSAGASGNIPYDALKGSFADPNYPPTLQGQNWPEDQPVLQVLDIDGDGKDDVLFQEGGKERNVFLLKTPVTQPAVSAPPLSSVIPLAGAYQPSTDLVSGGRAALQSVIPIDIDGDGASEIFVTQAQVNAAATAVTCQSKALHWQDATTGFVDMGLNLPSYECRNPFAAWQTHLFLDLNGDHLLDHLQANQADLAPPGGPAGSSDSAWVNVLPGPWKLAQLNTGENGVYGQSGLGSTGNLPGGIEAACPSYVVDFSGDGHGQLFGQNGNIESTPVTEGGQTFYTGAVIQCGLPSAISTQTTLDTYDPISGTWQENTELDPPSESDTSQNPLYPVIIGKNYYSSTPVPNALWSPEINGLPGIGTAPGLIFGDFNGDGLEDVIEPDQDAAGAMEGKYYLRWNTGNGFGPRIPLGPHPWARSNPEANPYLTNGGNGGLNAPDVQATFYKVYVADINHDGRADLIVFSNQVYSGITIELSNGDGTFTSMPVPDALSGGITAGLADAGVITDAGVVTGTIGDFNGDGYTDILRLQLQNNTVDGGSISATDTSNDPIRYGDVQVLTQSPQINDRITAVFDETMQWPREAVTYDLQWSDKPEAVTPCTYAQQCLRRGSPVVRELDSYDTWVDPTDSQTTAPHRIFYSYEDPVNDMGGRGYLGFRKVREWDPTQLRQTTTLYDNRTPTNGVYAGALNPQNVTTVVALPATSTPQTLPSLARRGATDSNARVIQTLYTNQVVSTTWPSGAVTYVIQPQTQVTTEWEQSVKMVTQVTDAADPTSDYMWGVKMPAYPMRVSTLTYDSIDSFGNVMKTTNTTQGGASGISAGVTRVTSANYDNRCVTLVAIPAAHCNVPTPGAWQIGLLRSYQITLTEPDATHPSVTRGVGYDYDLKGQLQTVHEYQVVANQPVLPDISTTTLTHDAYGLLTASSTQAEGADGLMQTRTTRTEYNPMWPGQPNERVFPSQRWSPTPYADGVSLPSTWTAIHPAYGVVSATMDVNGVQGTNTYDDQRRLVASASPGQAPVQFYYAGRPDQGAYAISGMNGLIIRSQREGQTATIITDSAGRTIGTTHLDATGMTTYTRVRYDLLGRPIAKARPYQSVAPAYETKVTYDGLGRLLTSTAPDNTVTTFTPTFFTQTSMDASGHLHKVTKDVDGRVIASANWLNNTWLETDYHYAPFNLTDTVKDPLGHSETTSYDSLGRITGSYSPDTGTTTNLLYDGFGELLQSTHAESGYTTSYDYDTLGRLTRWKSPDGPDGETSAMFSFDTQPNGLGKLATTLSSDNVRTVNRYDMYGRSVAMEETIDGVTYALSTSYDSQGRISQLGYPTVGSNPNPGMTLSYQYNLTGYLNAVNYQTAIPGGTSMTGLQPLWKVSAWNVDDAVVTGEWGKETATLQNSYLPATGQLLETRATPYASSKAAFDLRYGYYPNGLVQSRADTVNGRLETYTYDTLNRLATWSLATCPSPPCVVSGNMGNLWSYDYDASGNLQDVNYSSTLTGTLVPTQTNSYGMTAGPHALTQQNTMNFGYDNHGRQIAGGANGRKLTYNAYNLPSTISSGGLTWTLKYNALGQRVQKSGIDGTTTYVGGVYEHRSRSDGSDDVFLVPGMAQVVMSKGTPTTQYLMTDVLGSTGAVLDGVTGKTVTALFYEPFGNRINASGTVFTGYLDKVTEGFTGQEHDDDLGLINFRGRMYDPVLKRFLSPDPHVTHPMLGQNWNPYSYVMNSPLNLMDPSGYDDAGTAPPPGAPPGGTYQANAKGDLSYGYTLTTEHEEGVAPEVTIQAVAGGVPEQAAVPSDNGADAGHLDVSSGAIQFPTLAQWRAIATEQTLRRYDDVAKHSPAMAEAIKNAHQTNVNVLMTPTLDLGIGGVTRPAENLILIIPGQSPYADAALFIHEMTHWLEYLAGLNQGDINVQSRENYVKTHIEDEIQAFSKEYVMCAELIHNRVFSLNEASYTDDGEANSTLEDLYLYASFRPAAEPLDNDYVSKMAISAAEDSFNSGSPRWSFYSQFYGKFWNDNAAVEERQEY